MLIVIEQTNYLHYGGWSFVSYRIIIIRPRINAIGLESPLEEGNFVTILLEVTPLHSTLNHHSRALKKRVV